MSIRYSSLELAKFYSRHRRTWEELYPSERYVFTKVCRVENELGSVLDVGCAAGGVGRALAERFKLRSYSGIDINHGVIDAALNGMRDFPVPCSFFCGDIVDRPEHLKGQRFGLVCSLGCADWNVEPLKTIQCCWDYVADGGHLVLSLRLTNNSSVNDMARSYQYIHFGVGPILGDEERANYVVFNVHEVLRHLSSLDPCPGHLLAYGYWGKPSPSAVTPFENLVFAVFALKKEFSPKSPTVELTLPLDLVVNSQFTLASRA